MTLRGKTIEAQQSSKTPSPILAGKIGRLSLPRQMLTLAIWPLLEQILSFMVATTDLIISTRMADGPEKVAIIDALGLCGYLTWLLMILQGASATGVQAIVSRAAGARRQTEARKTLAQGVLLGFAIGTLSALALYLSAPFLVHAFGLDQKAGLYARQYLEILCWSAPLLGILYSCNSALRAIGDTRSPFLIMLLINLTNVTLSILFVFGPEPIGGLGIRGLALGSLASWLLGVILILAFLLRKPTPLPDQVTLQLHPQNLKIDLPIITRITRVGIPQGVEMLGMWLIHAYTIGFITRLTLEGALGAHFIAIRVESLSFLPGFAIGTAGATLIGQYLGAQNPLMARKALKTAWLFGLIFMSSIGILFLTIPEIIVRLIIPETDAQSAQVIATAVPLIILCGLIQPILATTMVLKTCLRGAGATRTVRNWSFASLLIIRALGITIVASSGELTLMKIWLIMSLDLLVQATIFSLISLRGRWLDTIV